MRAADRDKPSPFSMVGFFQVPSISIHHPGEQKKRERELLDVDYMVRRRSQTGGFSCWLPHCGHKEISAIYSSILTLPWETPSRHLLVCPGIRLECLEVCALILAGRDMFICLKMPKIKLVMYPATPSIILLRIQLCLCHIVSHVSFSINIE